ncbi:MAG: hypothetical protein RL226_1903 [Bacteroidota bacterium]
MKLLLAAFSLLLCLSAQATDSLLVALQNHPEDTNKVWLYREVAFELMTTDPDSALFFAQRALQLSEKLDFRDGIIRSLLLNGYCYEYKNNVLNAVEFHNRALALAEATGDADMVCSILNIIGFAYYYQGDKANALMYFSRVERQCASVGDGTAYAQALNNIGVIFKTDGKYAEGADIYRKSIAVKSAANDTAGLATSYYNLAICLAYSNREDEGLQAFETAELHYRALQDTAGIISVLGGKGQIYCHFNRYPEAIQVLSQAVEKQHLLDNTTRYEAVLNYTEALRVTGKYSEALAQAEALYTELEGSDRLQLQRKLAYELALNNKELGRFEAAVPHYEKLAALTDSIYNTEKSKILEELQTKYKTKENEATIAMQQRDLEVQERERQLLLFGTILVALLAVFIMLYALNKMKTNRQLRAQKETIQQALNDRELLLREIHHRVKNNLQVVSSLLSLQGRQLEDSGAQEAMLESRNRVQSMALIHESLYSHNDLRDIQASEYIERLCQGIFDSYRIDPSHITLTTNISPLQLDVDETVPLGLIINELITNCIKYAFKEQNGNIHIELTHNTGEITLSVADNGAGYPTEAKAGFGTRLINSFARKLNAQWSVSSSNGTIVTLKYQLKTKSADHE